MEKEFTIAYITGRNDPKSEWFFSSLCRQITNEKIHVVIIDYWSWFDKKMRQDKFGLDWLAADPRKEKLLSLTVSEPKPNVYQGPLRKTQREYWAASSTRNTAAILCQTDYIVYVDDLSILYDGWLANACHAVWHNYVVFGAYLKAEGLSCVDGKPNKPLDVLIAENQQHLDSRYKVGSSAGIVKCPGSMMFGCSFGMPISLFEETNGFDEACDSLSFEDVPFGIRLEKFDVPIFYNRNMMTLENNELHFSPGNQKVIRFDTKKDRSLNIDEWQKIDESNVPQWLQEGLDIDYSHFILRWAQNNKRTYFNEHTIKQHREYYKRTKQFLPATMPKHSLQTGRLLTEM